METTYYLDSDTGEDMGYKAPDEPVEISLWRAVLLRAIKDAIGEDIQAAGRYREIIQTKAQRWIYEGGKDFELVCRYAGLEPKNVQYAALDFITKPTPDKRSLYRNGRHTNSRTKQHDVRLAA